jgi:alcohol dehydrogenase
MVATANRHATDEHGASTGLSDRRLRRAAGNSLERLSKMTLMTMPKAATQDRPGKSETQTMKALVYQAVGKKAVENRPKPEIAATTDAIVKIVKTTICGTDLHIVKGDLASCKPGRILGHEGVGIVDKVGPAVTAFKAGDRVLISCVSACGKCVYCRKQMYSHCTTGGWILGNTIDGTQAEFVRIPHADNSLYPIPAGADEDALVMLSDILPTGFECGVLNGKVEPGCTVAIVGSGPIGLAALLTAQFYSPGEIIMIDLDDNRLAVAKRFGATATINSTDGEAVAKLMKMTGGRGVDTAIEAVGIPATFEMCEQIVAAGGTIANIGVHGKQVALHLERLWDRNIDITTRLVDTASTPMLLNIFKSGKIDPKLLITHHFKFDKIMDAYETFGHAADTKALKVIIEA